MIALVVRGIVVGEACVGLITSVLQCCQLKLHRTFIILQIITSCQHFAIVTQVSKIVDPSLLVQTFLQFSTALIFELCSMVVV